MSLILDIETHYDKSEERKGWLKYKQGAISAPSTWKDPEKIENYIKNKKGEAYQKFGLSPMTGMVTCVGLLADVDDIARFSIGEWGYDKWNKVTLEDSGETVYHTVIGYDGTSEEKIISITWEYIKNFIDENHKLVTYNGKKFDLPFLWRRAVLLGVRNPIDYIHGSLLNLWRNDVHLDLYHVLGEGAQVEWSYLIGASSTLDRDNQLIFGWNESGEYQKVIDKNIMDLYQTYELYKRVNQWAKIM